MANQADGGNDAEPATTQSEAQQAQAGLPLFYKAPKALQMAVHGGMGLRQPPDYRFASSAHAVILHAQEFRLAAAHYPIIFAEDDRPMPLALFGFREGENFFVDADGAWAPGTYIPSYVRRYPFATGPGGETGKQVLYIDEASDLLVDPALNPGAEPLFVDGEPSERTRQATELCAAFDRETTTTLAFVDELKARDLLASKEITLQLLSGASQVLQGLRVVDEQRFNALTDEVFLEWRRQGWVALVHWHWASMDNFLRMAQRG